MPSDFEKVLLDVQKEYRKSNKIKDKIIVILIVFIFLEAVIGFRVFVFYESQFDYVTTETTDSSSDIEINSDGENANASYVEGNQYNDNAVHSEGGDKQWQKQV